MTPLLPATEQAIVEVLSASRDVGQFDDDKRRRFLVEQVDALRAAILAERADARRQALEEAADVCSSHARYWGTHISAMGAGCYSAVVDCAIAIRALLSPAPPEPGGSP